MGIKALVRRAGNRAADTITKLSVLSPEQLHQLQERRDAYLLEKPEMTGEAAEELTRRMLAAGSIEIYNEYLLHLKDFYVPVKEDAEYETSFHPGYNIRYFNITKWVSDKKENSLEKLINVYAVLSNEDCNIALVFHRLMSGTKVYLAVTNTQNAEDNVDVENYRKRLEEAIRGNFPGTEWESKGGKGVLPCMKDRTSFSVAIASNIPGEKSEKFVSQTIEKLLDGIIPDTREKEYILVLLATPINDMEDRKLHLADLYTGLAPYAGWQTNFTYTQADSTTSMATFGVNAGVSAGVQSGRNSSVSNTSGTTETEGETTTDSTGKTTTDSSRQRRHPAAVRIRKEAAVQRDPLPVIRLLVVSMRECELDLKRQAFQLGALFRRHMEPEPPVLPARPFPIQSHPEYQKVYRKRSVNLLPARLPNLRDGRSQRPRSRQSPGMWKRLSVIRSGERFQIPFPGQSPNLRLLQPGSIKALIWEAISARILPALRMSALRSAKTKEFSRRLRISASSIRWRSWKCR